MKGAVIVFFFLHEFVTHKLNLLFCIVCFTNLFAAGSEAQAGQKPQDAHYCICWQPSGRQRKGSESSPDLNQSLRSNGCVLPYEQLISDHCYQSVKIVSHCTATV